MSEKSSLTPLMIGRARWIFSVIALSSPPQPTKRSSKPPSLAKVFE
jgi:hypothetical protein